MDVVHATASTDFNIHQDCCSGMGATTTCGVVKCRLSATGSARPRYIQSSRLSGRLHTTSSLVDCVPKIFTISEAIKLLGGCDLYGDRS